MKRIVLSIGWFLLIAAFCTAVFFKLQVVRYAVTFDPKAIIPVAGHAWGYPLESRFFKWRVLTLADTDGDRSLLTLTENGETSKLAAASESAIETKGLGGYRLQSSGASHFVIFSPSDNSDPRTNARVYAASVPYTTEPRIFRYMLIGLLVLTVITLVASNGPFRTQAAASYIPPPEIVLSATSERRRARTFAITLLGYACGIAVLLAIVNGAIFLRDRKDFRMEEPGQVPSLGQSIIFWKTRNVMDGAIGARDVLFVGDSSSALSIEPTKFTKLTGLSSTSLGSDGSYTLDIQNRLLDLYLSRNPPPKLIVAHMSLLVLGVGVAPGFLDTYKRNRIAGLTWMDGYVRDAHAPTFNVNMVSAYFSAKALVDPGFRSNDPALFEKRGPYPSDADIGRGLVASEGYVANPNRAVPGSPIPSDLGLRFPDFFAPMLSNLFQMAATRHIPMLFVANPLSERFDTPSTRQYAVELEQAVSKIAAGFPNVCIVQPFLRFYPDEEAFDNAHLVLGGLEKNVQFLADAARKGCPAASPGR